MKKYHLFATLSFVFVSVLIEIMMSTHTGFTTFAGFNWFINPNMLSVSHILTWIIHGLALSFAAFLYMNRQPALADGLRFGIITGLVFVLLVLFNLMWQIDHSHYPFLAEALLPLVSLQLLGFAVSGWLFGLMYDMFSPKLSTIHSLWSLA